MMIICVIFDRDLTRQPKIKEIKYRDNDRHQLTLVKLLSNIIQQVLGEHQTVGVPESVYFLHCIWHQDFDLWKIGSSWAIDLSPSMEKDYNEWR